MILSSKKNKRSKKVNVISTRVDTNFSASDKKRIDKVAYEYDISRPEVIRRLVDNYIDIEFPIDEDKKETDNAENHAYDNDKYLGYVKLVVEVPKCFPQ